MTSMLQSVALSRRAILLGSAGVAAMSLAGRLPFTALAQDGATTIRWSLEGISDLVSLDPAKASDAQGFTAVGQLYSGLVRLDENLLVVPDLAESWEVSEDGLTYTFKLRGDSAFSDGSPITADDVVWSLNHAVDPATGGWTGGYYLTLIDGVPAVSAGEAKEITGAKAIDASTVELKITQPSAYFLSILSLPPAMVVSKAAAETSVDDGKVSSGPFMLQSRTAGQGMELVPNTNYWQSPAKVSTLTFLFNQDSETAYQLFRTEKLDIMGSSQNPVPAARIAEVKDSPDFKQASAFNIRYVAFNNELEPFNNVAVRQALASAIDRDTLASAVLGGTVTASDRILPAGIPGSEMPIAGIGFDPEKGKALLAEAGIDPANFTFKLTYGVEGDNEKVVTVLQSMWQENLGIKVELEPLELSTFSSRLNDTFMDPKTGLQAYYSIWGADYPDPQNFLSLLLQTGVGNNNSHYSNEEFDALTKEADVIVDDFPKRAELYNKAEQIAIDEVAWLPLFTGQVNVLVRDCVQGVVVTGNGVSIPNYAEFAGCA